MGELAYVLVNPHTIYKSRTGGVLGRLLSRSATIRIAGVRMFAPSAALVNEYAAALAEEHSDAPDAQEVDRLIHEYVLNHYMPGPDGRRKRVMFFLLEGDDVVRRIRREVVGSIIRQTIGETIRDTYGDYIKDKQGSVVYFEPAVLIGSSPAAARKHIDIWMKHSAEDSGILYDVLPRDPAANVQNTLVMIKPDSLAESRTRAGTVIDLFSKTGLCIIGIKMIRISVAQAMEFYGPVRDVFVRKFVDRVREKSAAALRAAFEFPIPDALAAAVADQLKEANADHEFGKIVQFMTGRNPWQTPREQWNEPGTESCLALVYQGVDAVAKIREQLGSTDPRNAAPATVRKEFGRDVMVNTAHASDSPESAVREIRILDLERNDLPGIVERNDGYSG
ncbi:nucleoside-diphosphate kinase [bacterium]|nr:nucleoside-diphosphate kinase [bacterium]